jgi:urea carboxylase
VHYNSSRTGVRLIGPKPMWARADGGEAGLHPSNIHDNAYAIGAIDFTGDMPVILGPDGPSLGGFVCPATIVRGELWKVGQLKPGDKVRFHCISAREALDVEQVNEQAIRTLRSAVAASPAREISPERSSVLSRVAVVPAQSLPSTRSGTRIHPEVKTQMDPRVREDDEEKQRAVLASFQARKSAQGPAPAVCYRQAGDKYLLVEYGPHVLDLELRFRVHALMQWLRDADIEGVSELTPGIRSLQIHYESRTISQQALLKILERAEEALPSVEDVEVPSRIVRLPLSWDDPATRLAIDKYMQSVRSDAPWCPSNLEFIRRINGLDSIDDVRRIFFDASYLVMGLGDVYLGAPVATPLDPRHRLVTTKYNPARTWTPENAVGIGGAYLCVYGMEGPGGYQFVGRTIQMWNRYRQTQDFIEGKQWLLRFFDQLRFYPVSAEELLQLREDFPRGRFKLRIEQSTLRLREYREFLRTHAPSIEAFKARQHAAFEAERERWRDAGQLTFDTEAPSPVAETNELTIPDGANGITSPVAGNVWKLAVQVGQHVNEGDELLVIEAMKMEIPIVADEAGEVIELRAAQGSAVRAGDVLVITRSRKVAA